jgi:branched-chain amino acid transport system ATP-binding protein
MTAILETSKLTKRFGGVSAVNDLDMVVNEGEILGLIGPNGAGKSTVFSMIGGFQPPSGGKIFYQGRDITGMQAHNVARLGIARVFQQSLIFGKLSVLDNVFVGCHKAYRTPEWQRVLRLPGARREEKALRAKAAETLTFMGLEHVQHEEARSLPHGFQRALSMAVALATGPKLLLLDEPVTGMNPSESKHMTDLIQKIRDLGITIMLVEHDMKVVMGVCERVVVINFGEKLCEGPPEYVRAHPDVCAAYLGKGTFDVA